MTGSLSPTSRLAAELFAPVNAEIAGGKATVRVFGRIDPDGAPWGISSGDFQAALDTLSGDVTDVEVQVQTRGGDAFEGVAIMNMIRALPQTTEAVVVGLAASAGSYIVQGADKVTMAPHSQMMIHRASALALGQAPDMRMAADRLESIDKTMANIYTEKAGGSPDEWLAAMTPETWYTADEAVAAGLADGTRPDVEKPAGAKAALDLSVFAYAGREHAPDPFIPQAQCRCGSNGGPALPGCEHRNECPTRAQSTRNPTDPEEDGSMPDTIPTAGVCRALGLPSDADEQTVLAALNQALEERAEPDPAPDPAPVAAVPEGHVVVSQLVLDELRENAAAGREARAQQLREARDEAIDAAVNDGRISRARVDAWRTSWDRDPDGTRADLDSLQPRFPVAQTTGYAGSDTSDGAGTKPFTDEEGDALAALAGLPAGVLR